MSKHHMDVVWERLKSASASEMGSSMSRIFGDTNIQVIVRCRPPTAEEGTGTSPIVISCDSEANSLSFQGVNKRFNKPYNFDKVFGMYSTQEEVFESIVRPMVQDAIAGYNCTIFAYGQGGSGKTHTIEGDIHSPEEAGIIPRSVKAILGELEGSGLEYAVRVSFLDLHNEELFDLLASPNDVKKIKLFDHSKGGVLCQGLEEVAVLSAEHTANLLQKGFNQRQASEALRSKTSVVRSHTIFTVKITISEKTVDGEDMFRIGQLNIVDLAGSENTGRLTGKSGREGGCINQSLLTLSRVVNALVDRNAHVPYRDSKLTRLLQDSLGGKGKTCMIATIKPTLSAAEESISTLDFAFRAKNIKNTPTIIQRSSKKVVLKEYLAEMEQLRAQLQITREKNGVYVDPTQYAAMEAKVARLTESEAALREANEENRNLKKEVEDVTHKLGNAEIRLGSTMRQLDDLTGKLASLENELNTLQIERMAAEAVVNAQATNEQTLRSQGAALQSEVLSNRDDIHRLFEKINGLGVKEHQRVLDTQEFLGDINLKKSHLLVSLEAATELNTAKQLEFCEGISELLAKGRSTCDVLKRAIEEALPVFLDDASASSESIATASVELQTHLSNVTAGTEAALRELHLQLSMWVGEVTTTAEIMQVQLDDQQTQLSCLMTDMSSQASTHEELCAAYLEQQELAAAAAAEHTASMKEQLQLLLAQYESATKEEAEKAKGEVQAKTHEIQRAMTAMLNDMLHSTLQAFDQSAHAASTFTLSANSATSSSIHALETNLALSSLNGTANLNKIRAHVKESTAANTTSVEAAVASGAGVRGETSTLTDKAESMEATFDSDTAAAMVDMSASLTAGQRMAQSIHSSASHTMDGVADAAVKLAGTANDAIDSFSSHMDERGDPLNDAISSYLQSVGATMASQHQGVTAVGEAVRSYGLLVALVVDDPSDSEGNGSVPQVREFAPLEELAEPTDAEGIRDAARAQYEHGDREDGSGNGGSRRSSTFSTGAAVLGQNTRRRRSLAYVEYKPLAN